MDNFQLFKCESEKVHPVSGLKYTVRLTDFPLTGETGETEATMFSFSYVRAPRRAGRPVAFAYNGGPGSASVWLHMGLLGPKLVRFSGYPDVERPAHFELTDNTEFLLDQCDLVLIDPAGTGWAKPAEKTAAKAHYATAGDARDFARLIAAWLKENGREGDPVYLIGESYGTIRNLALADALDEGINLRGIVHIGTSINVGARGAMYVEPNVRRLGANAAACWYHHHRDAFRREDFVAQAMDFAYGDYARALLLGSRLDRAERESVLDRLAYYTGLDQAFLDSNGLRFGEIDFLLRLVPGEAVSMYDSRLTYRPEHGESYTSNKMDTAGIVEPDLSQDAFMSCVGTSYEDAFARYVKAELAAPENREMAGDMLSIAKSWDYRSFEKDTLELPVELMRKRPELRMLFVNGCYDLTSTFDFMVWYLSQYDLDDKRIERLVLPSGHASYVGEGMSDALNRKIREFICEGGE